jgi:hypothetical protein
MFNHVKISKNVRKGDFRSLSIPDSKEGLNDILRNGAFPQ